VCKWVRINHLQVFSVLSSTVIAIYTGENGSKVTYTCSKVKNYFFLDILGMSCYTMST
jgi:hypothetical protein